jgi:riboflavin-specific deaminase-like protein
VTLADGAPTDERPTATPVTFRGLYPDPAPTVELDEAYRVGVPPVAAPFLRANFAVSLDGAVEVAGRSAGLSSPADRQVFRTLRGLCDVVLVGAGTVRAERYRKVRLPPDRQQWRAVQGLAPVPRLAVLSGGLELDLDYPLFQEDGEPPLVITTGAAPPSRRRAAARFAEVVVLEGDGSAEPAHVVDALVQRNLSHILCEGGPTLLTSLLSAGLVDELCLSIAPMVTGPGGRRLLAGSPLAAPLDLGLTQVLTDDSTLFVRYRGTDSPREGIPEGLAGGAGRAAPPGPG